VALGLLLEDMIFVELGLKLKVVLS
jgi:hypothetical protein